MREKTGTRHKYVGENINPKAYLRLLSMSQTNLPKGKRGKFWYLPL
jgi:hypothetical protein